MAKRRKVSLPRVTVLALSKRDLVAFVTALEQLTHQVERLEELVTQWTVKQPRKTRSLDVPVPPGPASTDL